jgi:UDP-N-acetylglucosamine 2-epimerase (non-hydrolysing)
LSTTRLRLATILGTRPEIIRLAEIIRKCDRFFDHVLIHTGQNYDYTLNEIFFQDLGIRQPDHYLNVAGAHLGETLGNVISRSWEVLSATKPDALLVLGDTNSVLCTIPAKRLKIPIFHMEAGNRCFDQNVPEEINRKISDHIADINLTYTEHSRRYLLSEGFRKDQVFVTGSPMTEVLTTHQARIAQSSVLARLGIHPRGYILMSAHREENIDLPHNLATLHESVNAVAERYQLPIIFSTHPRTRKRIELEDLSFHPLVRNVEPLGFFDYVHLQQHAFVVLSDSGTLSEESAILGFPAVSIRTSTERPEAIDAGTIILGGLTTEGIINSIDIARGLPLDSSYTVIPEGYQVLNVSDKVVRLIQGYTAVVNRTTWNR